MAPAEEYLLEPLAEIIPVFWLQVADHAQQGLVVTRLAYWLEAGLSVAPESTLDVDMPSGSDLYVVLVFSAHSSAVYLDLDRAIMLDLSAGQGQNFTGFRNQPESRLEVTALRYLELEDGLLGIPDWRQFLLYSRMPEEAVGALIPLNQTASSLAVIDPRTIIPNYDPRFEEVQLDVPAEDRATRLDCICILNIQQEPIVVRANLLGPVVFDRKTGAGCQVILSQSLYPVDFRIGAPAEAEEN